MVIPDPAATGAGIATGSLAQSGRSARRILGMTLLTLVFPTAFVSALLLGSVAVPLADVLRVLVGASVENPVWHTIVMDVRLPRAITAAVAGAALSVAGVQMQTLFRNPLADPFVLGITSGAGLGVALVVLASGGVGFATAMGLGAAFGVTGAASVGALGVTLVLLLIAGRTSSPVTMLVAGLMIGYVTNALVSMLIWFADPNRVTAFLSWGFGSFRGTSWTELTILVPVVLVGIVATLLMTKQLNALLLGEAYAASMGVSIRRTRRILVGLAAVLAGSVTAFCGPIGFIGIAVPHAVRSLFLTSDHRLVLPGSALLGASAALVAEIVAQLPGADLVLPVNAVTALFGAPVVLLLILGRRTQGGFT